MINTSSKMMDISLNKKINTVLFHTQCLKEIDLQKTTTYILPERILC